MGLGALLDGNFTVLEISVFTNHSGIYITLPKIKVDKWTYAKVTSIVSSFRGSGSEFWSS